MYLAHYYRVVRQKPSKYLPLLYPLIVPFITLFSYKIPFQTLDDAFRYWFVTMSMQMTSLLLVRKAVYATAYNKWVRWFIVVVVCVTIILTFLFLEYHFFHITTRFNHLNKWWIPAFRYVMNIPIFIALWESIKAAEERKKIVIDNVALENENAKAQLDILLQEINPHFLFNCLTVLQAMVRSKDTRTEAFILKLGEVFQKTLKTDTGMVTLKEELDFFNAYMYLMTLRQEEAIFVKIEILENPMQYYLPAFSLQLLAENCIKHNIVSAAKPLYIHLYQKEPNTLTISNNYQPKSVKSESFGIGIQNLKKRYALEGIKQGVKIEQTATNYSTTIKLILK